MGRLPARGEEVTMLVAKPTTTAGVFDAPAIRQANGVPLDPIPVSRTISLCPLNQPLRPAQENI